MVYNAIYPTKNHSGMRHGLKPGILHKKYPSLKAGAIIADQIFCHYTYTKNPGLKAGAIIVNRLF